MFFKPSAYPNPVCQIKKGVIKACRIGVQYRFLGRDMLHMINRGWEESACQMCRKGRDWAVEQEQV